MIAHTKYIYVEHAEGEWGIFRDWSLDFESLPSAQSATIRLRGVYIDGTLSYKYLSSFELTLKPNIWLDTTLIGEWSVYYYNKHEDIIERHFDALL